MCYNFGVINNEMSRAFICLISASFLTVCPQVFILICLGNLTHHPAGVPYGNHIRRNVFIYNTPRTNYRIIPYGYSWKNAYISSDPDIIPDDDRSCNLQTGTALSAVQGMPGSGKDAVWGNEYIISKLDFCTI